MVLTKLKYIRFNIPKTTKKSNANLQKKKMYLTTSRAYTKIQ